ncbi:MAG: hypothetical protein ACAI34_08585 [Verrucomicrobium sp.]
MSDSSSACPQCTSTDLRDAQPFKRHVNIWVFLFGGFLMSLLWSGSHKKEVRCGGCGHVFEQSKGRSKVARVLLLGLILLTLLNILAQYYGWLE